MSGLHCKKMFISRVAYIRAQSIRWFVANVLSAISHLIHAKVKFLLRPWLTKGKIAPREAETNG